MKMNPKIWRRILTWVIMVVGLWLLIFEIPIFFTPLRFMPDRLVVYRYGESVTLTRSDTEYHKLYYRLREAGKGTIAHIVSEDLIMDSHNGNHLFGDQEERFRNEAIVVYAEYDSVQKGRLYGSWGVEYDLVAFVMDGEKSSVVEENLTDGVAAQYINTENADASYDMFANYGSLEKAAEYVDGLDFDNIQ